MLSHKPLTTSTTPYDTAQVLQAMTTIGVPQPQLTATLNAVIRVESLSTVTLQSTLLDAGVDHATILRIRRTLDDMNAQV